MPQASVKVNNCARVELKYQRIRDNQFAIPLNVNDPLANGYRDSGADISLACSKIVGTGIISLAESIFRICREGFSEVPLAKIFVKSPRFFAQMKTLK